MLSVKLVLPQKENLDLNLSGEIYPLVCMPLDKCKHLVHVSSKITVRY